MSRDVATSVVTASVLLWLASGACTGDIGSMSDQGGPSGTNKPGSVPTTGMTPPGPGTPPGTGTPPGPGALPVPKCDTPVDVSLGLMLRLTRAEYNNTVRDLLGDNSGPAQAFADDAKVGVFPANAIVGPGERELDDYRVVAEALADRAVANLAPLLPCTAAEIGTDGCAGKFIQAFGRRAFRRPLDAEDVRAYTALYATGKTSVDFGFGIGLVVRAMLQSSNFLYRVEVGEPVPARAGLLRLTAYEFATRMSYALWRSMPDDELLNAAAAGGLDTAAGVDTQVRRMLTSAAGLARARVALGDFVDGWMGLGELPDVQKDAKFRTFAAMVGDMRRESQVFFQELILNEDARIVTALTAPFTFATPRLATLYGADASGVATQFTRRTLLPEQRSGLLTHASLMSLLSHESSTSPVHRGLWVRTSVLCQPPPPPPPDVANSLPMIDPNLPIRQRLALHRSDPSCAGCHAMLEPLGFAFEAYDPIGAYRTMEGRNPINATTELTGTDVDGPVTGARTLADRLGRSAQVQDCMARQWLRFTQSRIEGNADRCTIAAVGSGLAASGGNLKEALIALVTSESFRYRRTEEVSR